MPSAENRASIDDGTQSQQLADQLEALNEGLISKYLPDYKSLRRDYRYIRSNGRCNNCPGRPQCKIPLKDGQPSACLKCQRLQTLCTVTFDSISRLPHRKLTVLLSPFPRSNIKILCASCYVDPLNLSCDCSDLNNGCSRCKRYGLQCSFPHQLKLSLDPSEQNMEKPFNTMATFTPDASSQFQTQTQTTSNLPPILSHISTVRRQPDQDSHRANSAFGLMLPNPSVSDSQAYQIAETTTQFSNHPDEGDDENTSMASDSAISRKDVEPEAQPSEVSTEDIPDITQTVLYDDGSWWDEFMLSSPVGEGTQDNVSP